MTVRWITSFLDSPADAHDRRSDFWCQITGSTRSAPRGSTGEFITLVPPNGDAYLRAQRTTQGPGGLHLDLHVDNIQEFVSHATACGATIVADRGYVILSSPGKFTFCIVSWHGETLRPRSVGDPASLVDQVALDVPFELFDTECEFWASLTGWELAQSMRAEFCLLARPQGMPLRVLLQRLGPTDAPNTVTAHLDAACGGGIGELIKQHTAFGAELIHSGAAWSTLRDPTGLHYCLTSRDPETGLLSGSNPELAKSAAMRLNEPS